MHTIRKSTFSQPHFSHHLSETLSKVGCAGDVAGGLHNRGEPGKDIAWEVEAGVEAGPAIGQFILRSNTEL